MRARGIDRPRWCIGIARRAVRRWPRARELEPYQMVRSLQLVRDRIASGDDAALPMQRKLLEMIDSAAAPTRMTSSRAQLSGDACLRQGGNPATIDKLLSELHPTRPTVRRGSALRLPARRSHRAKALGPVDPLTQPRNWRVWRWSKARLPRQRMRRRRKRCSMKPAC
jgi:hypothetical protein